MIPPDPVSPRHRFDLRFAGILLGVVLAFHLWGVSVGWSNPALPGNEFRQTQTAISAFFIQQEHNFALAYPTPVLGKPWSIPFEFPLYQWSVVVASNAFRIGLPEAGRLVSAACFYLMLPALGLILGRWGIRGAVRLVALAAVVTCPLYIFYSRAFLIETMALMFSLWFLAAYIRGVEDRSALWLVVANIAGALAGLVKVTTFMLYLMPAVVWSLGWLWQDLRRNKPERWAALGRRLGWIALATVLPFVATCLWLRFADFTKSQNPSGAYLVSSRMHAYNFGTAETRFAPAIWSSHLLIILREIAARWLLIATAVIALIWGRRWWRAIALLGFFFLAVQVMFPVLYAWHEYYWVANSALLMVGVGLALGSLVESRLPRWLVWPVVVGILGTQLYKYTTFYLSHQKSNYVGAYGLAAALKTYTRPEEVLLIAGDDWSSIMAYYAQRRAFMIRRHLENDWEMIDAAFARLDRDKVRVLVLRGEQRENGELLNKAAEYFHLDRDPALTSGDCAVYLRNDLREEIFRRMKSDSFFDVHYVSRPGESDPDPMFVKEETEVTKLNQGRRALFQGFNPQPVRFYTSFGMNLTEEGGRPFLSAHPDTKLWFRVSPGKHHIEAEFRIAPGAYDSVPAGESATDGVEYAIFEQTAAGQRRALFSRTIDPYNNRRDRGVQKIAFEVELAAGSELLFSMGPGPAESYNRDWAEMGPIEIR